MNSVQAIILSIIEGVTEFLPISSTGHLILASSIMKLPQSEFTKLFEIIIQFGAILAVFPIFIKKIKVAPNTIIPLILGFLPTAIVGVLFYKKLKTLFLVNPMITVYSLIIGGLILILFERFSNKNKQSKTIDSLTSMDAVIIGLFQSISIIPGVSRAAATIVGSMLVGLTREEAVSYSFLLAVPTIAAASLYDLIKSKPVLNSQEIFLLLMGIIASYIVACITIKFFLAFVKRSTFVPFGIYRILLGIIFFFLIP